MFFWLLKLIWANILHFLAEKLFLGNFNSKFPSKPETQELRLPGPWWRLNRISVWWSYTRQDPSTWQKIQRSNSLKAIFFWGGRSFSFWIFRDLDLVFSFRHLHLTWFRFCVFGGVGWWKSSGKKWRFPMIKWFSDVWIPNSKEPFKRWYYPISSHVI